MSAVDRYLALSPSDFPYLRRMIIGETRGENGPEVDLELRFHGGGENNLTVRCRGVRDVVFRQPWTSDMKVHSLEVTDVSTAQMEDIRFEVQDLEEECLSFKCRTFETERSDG